MAYGGPKPMMKLLEAFKATPSLANAKRLVTYVARHPMSLCMVTEDEVGMVRCAELMVLHG
jgi:hypothetical protein